MRKIAWIGLCLWPWLVAPSKVYRCETGGQVTYTDRACEAGAAPADLPPIGVVPGSKGVDLAKQYDAREKREREAHDKSDRAWRDAYAAREAQEDAAEAALAAGRTVPGMSATEARQVLGRPDRVQRRGRRETWIYEDGTKGGRKVVIEDGRVAGEASGEARSR